MKTKLLSITFLVFISLLSSCNSVNKSAETAEKFYEALKTNNYDQALSFCSDQAFKGNSKEEWMNLLKNRGEFAGKLKSYKRTGFNVQTKNGVNTAQLTYETEYDKASYDEKISFLEKDGTYEIIGYEYHK